MSVDVNRIASHAPPLQPRLHARSLRRARQVASATLLVAGCPVALVWWLRESGTVTSPVLALLIGMALSLLASGIGRFVWEKRPGSEDLLFNELMVWGYIQRRRKQRRLGNAARLISAGEPGESRRQQRLLERLVSGMETRDPYLHGHSRRVARHSWMIAQRMKLPREEVARIRAAAALHDAGKTKTPKRILHKAGRLTDEEFRIIKLHPGEGAEMVSVLGDPELAAIVRHHHERLDGSGYPDGLAGEAIPIGARIIAVADTFDAITSARPYRAASPHKRAIDILHEESGTRLDGDVVKAFCANYAGRGPLALWSFVCGLPERIVAWFSMSVGAVATAAKVVVVAAVVGGAAATSATLGLSSGSAAQAHRHGNAASAIGSAQSRAIPTVGAAPGSGALAGSPRGASTPGKHASRAGAKAAPVASAAVPAAQIPSAPTVTGVAVPGRGEATVGPSGQGSVGPERAPGTHEESSGGKKEQPKAKHEEAAAKKEEPKAKHEEAAAKKEEPKAKHEEAVAKKEEPKAKHEEAAAKTEEHGKSSESVGHAKKEEAAAPSGSASVSGTGEEPGHGKSSEAPGKNKP